jgi:hypothetical protein
MTWFNYDTGTFTSGYNRQQIFGHKGKYNNIHFIRNPGDKGHYGNKYKNAIQSWHDRWHGNASSQYHSFRTAKQVWNYATNKSVKALQANWRRRKSNRSNKHYNSKYWRRVALYGRAARLGKIPVNQANRAVNRMRNHQVVKVQAAWRSFAARDKFLDKKNTLSSAALLSPGFAKLGAVWRGKLARRRLAKRIKINSINPYYKGTLNDKGVARNKYITRHGRTRYKDGLKETLLRKGLIFRKPIKSRLKVL